MSEVIVVGNPNSLPVDPQDALSRVSASDIANLVKLREIDRLREALDAVVRQSAELNDRAQEIVGAYYRGLAEQVCAMLEGSDVLRSAGVKIRPSKGKMRINLSHRRLWWETGAELPGYQSGLPIHEWYAAAVYTRETPVNHVRYALFRVRFGGEDGDDDTEPCSPDNVRVVGGSVEVQVSAHTMPMWNLEGMEDFYREHQKLDLERAAIERDIARLERPGVVEAMMTEHILGAAGVDISVLRSKIQAAIGAK